MCWEEEAPVRSRRGTYWMGTFLHGGGAARGWVRGAAKPRYVGFPTPLKTVGFRCVYSHLPEES
jgi:hypothetical protein